MTPAVLALSQGCRERGEMGSAAEHGMRCYRRRNQHQYLCVQGLCFIHPIGILLEI